MQMAPAFRAAANQIGKVRTRGDARLAANDLAPYADRLRALRIVVSSDPARLGDGLKWEPERDFL